jgi:hypothetical protein
MSSVLMMYAAMCAAASKAVCRGHESVQPSVLQRSLKPLDCHLHDSRGQITDPSLLSFVLPFGPLAVLSWVFALGMLCVAQLLQLLPHSRSLTLQAHGRW